MIELKAVEKEYGIGDTRVNAIRGITLHVDQGEFLAILGKSGSGKSTLLSLLGGLEQPTKGHILYKEKDLGNLSEDELAIMRRTEVGIVFQHFHLMDAMTALDNVELPLLIAGQKRSERREWALKVLTMVGLRERAAHYPNELSGGERQRVGIARAFANKASLIIADEPTGDLDSTKGKEIIDMLWALNRGMDSFNELDWKPTIIMVTHDVGMLREGMRVLTISDGMIISDRIFDGNYEAFDPLGNPSTVTKTYEQDGDSTVVN
ncbi:MAG: ABC transporter ATP-binding protein [Candidatus Heimdallarchaeota archaeon]|nr:ABC transporter ATP-binding protein [Candidatus Heimdallarchaeota archaeon]MDH5644903.1 ABC transporter ATP-binding protein [Candidatus Heimdallarchaeota archaeon]